MKHLRLAIEQIDDPNLDTFVLLQVEEVERMIQNLEERIQGIRDAVASKEYDPYHLWTYASVIVKKLQEIEPDLVAAAEEHGAAIKFEEDLFE